MKLTDITQRLRTVYLQFLTFLPSIVAVAFLVWWFSGHMTTRQDLKLENLKGQLTALERIEPEIAKAAAELRAAAAARIREAALVAMKENGLRIRAEQERDAWKQKAEDADRRALEEQRRHETQVAAIPSLQDAKLAELTAHQLKTLYKGAPLFVATSPDFTVNRNGVELTFRAGLEVESLRFVKDRQAERIEAADGQVLAVTEQRDSNARELAAERSAKSALQASGLADKSMMANISYRLDTYERMAATTKSAARWSTAKRIAVVGGLVAAGVISGDRAGYGVAAGAVGVSVLTEVF